MRENDIGVVWCAAGGEGRDPEIKTGNNSHVYISVYTDVCK